MENKNQNKCYRKRFIASDIHGYLVFAAEDLSHIHSEAGVVRAYLNAGKPFTLNKTIAEIEDSLDPECFFRVNRQTIVSAKSIARINVTPESKVILKLKSCPDKDFVVSRERTARLKEWLDR